MRRTGHRSAGDCSNTVRTRHGCGTVALLAPQVRHSLETASSRTERLIKAPRAGTLKMKLSIALLAAPALAFAPQAQQRASVKVEDPRRKIAPCEVILRKYCVDPARRRADAATKTTSRRWRGAPEI